MRSIDLRTDTQLEITRPSQAAAEPLEEVKEILRRVRSEGDRALVELTERFDGVVLAPGSLRVPAGEIAKAVESVGEPLMDAMGEAASRIRRFAQHQLIQPWTEEIGDGSVGEAVFPVTRAGVYVPGGRAAYPSTVLMCAVPASVAGVEEVALCVPPSRDGSVAGATLAAAHLAGVTEVYRVGGAQAIGALAYGTETIPRVDLIVGPGNIYVALAKKEVAGTVAIDSVAGPSEIAIVADRSADPRFLAADLIAQAEHGPGGAFVLVSWDETILAAVGKCLKELLDESGASSGLRAALEEGAVSVLVSDAASAIDAVNRFAPEHLELVFDEAERWAKKARAGAIFVGPFSPVSIGDYLAGSNHVLPTGGAARWASGLRASIFQRTSALVAYDRAGLQKTQPFVRAFADAEGLPNHARAIEVRLTDH